VKVVVSLARHRSTEPFSAFDVSAQVAASNTRMEMRLPKFYYKIREGEEVDDVNGGFELADVATAKK
jgi:hypothetical protein